MRGKALFIAVVGFATFQCTAIHAAPFMIVGNDEKVVWDDQGKPILSPPGKDSILIVDLANPLDPKIVSNIQLKNSVVGPPTNVAIHPSGLIAIVADSVNIIKDGDALKQVPDDKIYIIDLKSNPAKVIDTITAGKQPSGLSINRAGNLALVANRADKSISVLSIDGTTVKVTDTIPMGDEVSAVVFTPDGKHALATKNASNKVALLDVTDGKVTYTKRDLLTGLYPYNIEVSPNGQFAITADNGDGGTSDGNVDTVSVIDLTAQPPRVIDHVTVPDSPEGLAISPQSNLAVAVDAYGSNKSHQAFFYHKDGLVTVLRVQGKKVTKLKDIKVGGLPEAACFTPDGKYLLVGNYLDQDFSILKVNGSDVVDTGKRFKVPGHPGSARMAPH
jgi:DNA-binding beta-propeller fold protein YncE